MSFERQIMSKDKYPRTFSKSNGGYCVINNNSNIFCNMHSFEIILRYSPVLEGEYSVM